jgi:hypothetical protein
VLWNSSYHKDDYMGNRTPEFGYIHNAYLYHDIPEIQDCNIFSSPAPFPRSIQSPTPNQTTTPKQEEKKARRKFKSIQQQVYFLVTERTKQVLIIGSTSRFRSTRGLFFLPPTSNCCLPFQYKFCVFQRARNQKIYTSTHAFEHSPDCLL